MQDIYDYFTKLPFFEQEFLGNDMLSYITSIVVFLVVMLLFDPLINLVLKISKRIANKTQNNADDKIIDYFIYRRKNAFVPLEIVVAFYIALYFLYLAPYVRTAIDGLVVILCTIFIVSILIDFLKYIIISKYGDGGNSDARANSLFLLLPIMRIVIWILAVFFILSNLGIDVTALITGLGIGGVAIALASQSFLSDLLSFVSIVSDKPIEIGDYITLGNIEGTVKRIGIKSVRLEQFTGEEVVIPNSKVTGTDLHNYKRMTTRRVDATIGLVMNTPKEKLKLVEPIMRSICEEQDIIEFGRCHLTGFSEFAIQFLLVYFIKDRDAIVFSTARQQVNFRILEEFAKNGISMAYPTSEVRSKQI